MVTVKLSSRVRCCLLSEGERKQKWVKGLFLFCFFIKTESVQIYSVFLTVFQVICSFPLPPLQTGDIPGPCQRTLLHTLHFAHALQSFLFTVVKKQNKQELKKKKENLNFFHLSVLHFLFICTFKFMVTGFESSGSSPSSKRCIILNRIRS